MADQPKFVSPVLRKSTPRLMGINHLFTIKGPFSEPASIAIDSEDHLYIADSGQNAVYVLNKEGKLLESIGRFGWRAGEFDSPSGIALDSQLRLYVADTGNNRIQQFSLIKRTFKVIAGQKDDPVSSLDGSSGISLQKPQDIAVDSRGYICIADTWNHRILRIDPLGRLQMEIGGMGWSGQQFRNPQGLAVDFKGNIYISDTGNDRIHKLDFSGLQLAVWGKEGVDKGQFRNPAGQAVDRYGNIYVADMGNHRVQIFNSEGVYLSEFGQRVLDSPVDVAVDGNTRAYVTDASAGDIEVFRIIYEMAEDTR